MKAAPFAYRAPETLEETLALLANGDGARVLAGGQSLVPMLKARVVKPTLVVDVNRVPGLDGIETEEDGSLRIGALTRQQTLLDSEVAREAQPLLHAAGRFAGFRATRHRGTIGGSLAHCDPASDFPAVILALGAELTIKGPAGERTVPAAEFFQGVFDSACGADEMLTEIGASPKDIDSLVVGTGPGSFTGTRIGLALARGFALACGVPVAGVSTLEALAAGSAGAVPVVDAGRREVFALLDARQRTRPLRRRRRGARDVGRHRLHRRRQHRLRVPSRRARHYRNHGRRGSLR